MLSFLTKHRKSVLAVIVIVLAAVVWHTGSRRRESSSDNADSTQGTLVVTIGSSPADVVFPVEVAAARRGHLVKRVTTSGTVRAKREVEIISRVGGEIDSVSGIDGKFVSQRDVLVRLDDKEYRLAYDKTASLLLAAQIEYRSLSTSVFIQNPDIVKLRHQLEQAEAGLQELETRWKKRIVTLEEYNRQKRDLEAEIGVLLADRGDVVASKSGLTSAKEAYERAKLDLESTEVRAPFSGYVADCRLVQGMRVFPQQVLLKLIDVSNLYVDVEVLESEVGKLIVGRRAEVSANAFPSQVFTGRIYTVNPIVDLKFKTVKVTVELSSPAFRVSANPLVLRPGMFCSVRLESEILPNRLLVPKSAILVRDQRTLLFVAKGGLAKWQYVDIGEDNEQFWEIKSGVAAGDTVIVGGHYTLAHDAKIKIESVR